MSCWKLHVHIEKMWKQAALLLATFVCQCAARGAPLYQLPLQPESSSKHLLLKDDLIAFHKNLTQIESITYNEQEVGEWLVESLGDQGYKVEKQYVDHESERFNIYAYLGKTRGTKLLVSSHIDTVRRSVVI